MRARRGAECSSTLSSASTLDGGEWSRLHPGHFTLGKRPSTHFTGDWVGPRASMNNCEIFVLGLSSP